MKDATPTALETAPTPQENPLERGPYGPTQVRSSAPQQPPSRRWIWWLVLLVLAGVGYWQWPRLKAFLPSGDTTAQQSTAKGGRGRRGAGGGTSQVVGARATRGNIKVFVTGLGAVTPIYTVSVNSRVTG